MLEVTFKECLCLALAAAFGCALISAPPVDAHEYPQDAMEPGSGGEVVTVGHVRFVPRSAPLTKWPTGASLSPRAEAPFLFQDGCLA